MLRTRKLEERTLGDRSATFAEKFRGNAGCLGTAPPMGGFDGVTGPVGGAVL
jgi:hypothetical protein